MKPQIFLLLVVACSANENPLVGTDGGHTDAGYDGGGGDADAGSTTGTLTIEPVLETITATLLSTKIVEYHVTSQGYSGTVEFDAIAPEQDGEDPSHIWTAVAGQTSVTIADGDTKLVAIILNVPTYPLTRPDTVKLRATIPGKQFEGTVVVEVLNDLYVTIPLVSSDTDCGFPETMPVDDNSPRYLARLADLRIFLVNQDMVPTTVHVVNGDTSFNIFLPNGAPPYEIIPAAGEPGDLAERRMTLFNCTDEIHVDGHAPSDGGIRW